MSLSVFTGPVHAVMVGVFAAAFLFDVNVMLLILAAAVVGRVSVLWRMRKGAKA